MSKRVLIADDELHIRLLIEQSIEELEDEDVVVTIVEDGGQALESARKSPPDVLILDVMMPRMNGYEVCETIRDDPRFAATHVILLTAKGQEYDRRRGMEAGANRYLTKPFNPDELLAVVRGALGLDGDVG